MNRIFFLGKTSLYAVVGTGKACEEYFLGFFLLRASFVLRFMFKKCMNAI